MRYEIKQGQVSESLSIDAPFDTRRDALEALTSGVSHACKRCGAEYSKDEAQCAVQAEQASKAAKVFINVLNGMKIVVD